MDKELIFSQLNDIYGGLLTEKQRESLDLYFSCDLSLSEIAEIKNISKIAIRDNIEKAKAHLLKYENTLKVLDTREKLKSLLEEDLSVDELKGKIKEILGE